jgi:hypothetical protein
MQVTYTFEDEDNDFDLEVLLDGARVGWARGSREGNRLHLADIQVNEHGGRPCAFLPWFIRKHLPPKRLRRQGIGSALLREYLRRADAAGIEEVWGSVVQLDLDKYPSLLEWYERHDFTISDPDEECFQGQIKPVKKLVRRGCL